MTKLIGYQNNNRVDVQGDIDYPDEMRLDPKLEPILDTFMVDKPLWTFQVTMRTHRSSEFLKQINILQDGEVLGYVRRGYVAGNDKYLVGNERIDRQMERRSFYSTSDVSKAISKIKKTFSARTVGEILDRGEKDASESLYDSRQRKWLEYSHLRAKSDKAMLEYVRGPGREAFMQFVRFNDKDVLEQMEKMETFHEEYTHIDAMHNAFQNDKAFIVVRKDSVYNVKQGSNIVRYTDTTMPEFMRRKLGMLKLVDDKTYITGCGFRVNDSTFVVMPEENEE